MLHYPKNPKSKVAILAVVSVGLLGGGAGIGSERGYSFGLALGSPRHGAGGLHRDAPHYGC